MAFWIVALLCFFKDTSALEGNGRFDGGIPRLFYESISTRVSIDR
jgi:hypothetical protein